ncbi:hypothetical protein EL22_08205 [Halostagnicola sp. A56]|uniref:hypothetical protein n=1 Tax=Halostagnicola sp. A56 TaxID=1495067 RepID=UPI0004A0CAB7|nr:hypothetical protein [Halostagnicola sp. A56]KDE57962.1 hypothetical protein EL22_08205 [Halostagnicola sp. A56]
MDRPLVYHVSQMIVGCGLILLGISSVVAGDLDGFLIPGTTALMIVGGVGILLGNGYHIWNENTDRVDIGPVSFWLSIVGAVLILLAGVLSLAV